MMLPRVVLANGSGFAGPMTSSGGDPEYSVPRTLRSALAVRR